jgi:hypothetical protein
MPINELKEAQHEASAHRDQLSSRACLDGACYTRRCRAATQLRLRQMSGVENTHRTFGKMWQQI